MTGLTSRNKGSRWALACRRALEALGLTVTARQPGETGDDLILGHPYDWVSVEAKNHKTRDLAGWVDQARAQARPGQLPVVWCHRPGRADPMDGYVVMRAGDWWDDITGGRA